MDKLAELTLLRKRYLELTRIFFFELQQGRTLEDLAETKEHIDSLLVDINHIETELNLKTNRDTAGA